MRLSNIREISANSLSLAMCSRHPRTVRAISFIAFRLIAGTQLVKYLPDRGLRAERRQSAARGQGIIHTDRIYRESAASLRSACAGSHSRLCHTAASRFPWTKVINRLGRVLRGLRTQDDGHTHELLDNRASTVSQGSAAPGLASAAAIRRSSSWICQSGGVYGASSGRLSHIRPINSTRCCASRRSMPNCDKDRLIDDVLRSWKKPPLIIPGGNHTKTSA